MIPITILTGLLGAGKSTLLRKILSEEHGLKVAVLLNEYATDERFGQLEKPMFIGEKGRLYEEWVEINNGCLCCAAKGQTIQALEKLTSNNTIDCIIIECSGLADPGPVITSIWVDEGLNSHFQLNAVITIVDVKRLIINDAKSSDFDYEFNVQLSYADLVVINKMDLFKDSEELDYIESNCEQIVSKFNNLANCVFTEYCDIDIFKFVLELRSYNNGQQIEDKIKKIRNDSKLTHSNVRCITIVVESIFKRSRLNELISEILWNNQEDKTKPNKYGKIRRIKASIAVEEEDGKICKIILQAVDDNYDEFEIRFDDLVDQVSRFVFIGENMDEKVLEDLLNKYKL